LGCGGVCGVIDEGILATLDSKRVMRREKMSRKSGGEKQKGKGPPLFQKGKTRNRLWSDVSKKMRRRWLVPGPTFGQRTECYLNKERWKMGIEKELVVN